MGSSSSGAVFSCLSISDFFNTVCVMLRAPRAWRKEIRPVLVSIGRSLASQFGGLSAPTKRPIGFSDITCPSFFVSYREVRALTPSRDESRRDPPTHCSFAGLGGELLLSQLD
jgi:hypothetical protein